MGQGGRYPNSSGGFIPQPRALGRPGSHRGGQHPWTQLGQNAAARCAPAVPGWGSPAGQGLAAPSLALPRGDPWLHFSLAQRFSPPRLHSARPAGMFSITQKRTGAAAKVNTGRMCSISTRLGCEFAAPLLCLRMLQPRGDGAESAFFQWAGYLLMQNLQHVVSLIQRASMGWGLNVLGEHPSLHRSQGVLGSWPCGPSRIKIFCVILCLARDRKAMGTQHGLESRARLWHVLWLMRTTGAIGIPSHIPDLGAWQLQNLPCIFAPCLVSGNGQKWEAPSTHPKMPRWYVKQRPRRAAGMAPAPCRAFYRAGVRPGAGEEDWMDEDKAFPRRKGSSSKSWWQEGLLTTRQQLLCITRERQQRSPLNGRCGYVLFAELVPSRYILKALIHAGLNLNWLRLH